MQKVINVYHTCGDEKYGKSGICFVVEKNKEKFMVPMDKFIYYDYDEQIIKDNYVELKNDDIKRSLIDQYNRRLMLYMTDIGDEMFEFLLDTDMEIYLCYWKKDKPIFDYNNILNNFLEKIIKNNYIIRVTNLSNILLDKIDDKTALPYIIPNQSKIIVNISDIDTNIIMFELLNIKDKSSLGIYCIYKSLINNDCVKDIIASPI